jgi:hypothetical protein
MTINRFDAMEKQTHILKEIAGSFPHESPQYIAIENASFALIFAISEHYESFVHFIEASPTELTDEQKEHLRKLGISF